MFMRRPARGLRREKSGRSASPIFSKVRRASACSSRGLQGTTISSPHRRSGSLWLRMYSRTACSTQENWKNGITLSKALRQAAPPIGTRRPRVILDPICSQKDTSNVSSISLRRHITVVPSGNSAASSFSIFDISHSNPGLTSATEP